MSTNEHIDAKTDPIALLEAWCAEALGAGIALPDAMTLATADAAGKPSARMVLYKGILEGGVVFYTNYNSPKADDLQARPQAALVFFWADLNRQIRVEGSVQRLTREQSERYFQTRPRESQLGAWASDQSKAITSREALEAHYAALDKQYAGKTIPCPPHWGGFCLQPERLEFWIGRKGRLHERYDFRRAGKGWALRLLSP